MLVSTLEMGFFFSQIMSYPEIARQQRDVEEGGTRQSVQDGNHCVKESQDESVAR
jgi:hypothetical protein